MDITRTERDGLLDVAVKGRLDGYWSDHLSQALTEAVHGGHHRIRLDCSGLSFLSSAGIAILVKFHKELARIGGAFYVANPSAPVAAVLRMTRLTDLLVEPAPSVAAPAAGDRPVREFERDGTEFEVYNLGGKTPLSCRAIGTRRPLGSGGFTADDCVSLESLTPAFAIGVGAFGGNFADCRLRFGELLSVAGATCCQPADGTDVPDYLLSSGALPADVRVLYCLACEGQFSTLVRFETNEPNGIGLASLAAASMEAAGSGSIGVVILAEAAGLVGTSLRRSPTEAADEGDFFAHPGIRARLSFTAEPAHTGSVALVAGFVARPGAGDGALESQLRPMGDGHIGHLHAAAFRFRAIQKGPLPFAPTVASLFEAQPLLGVLHLLHDDRGKTGVGESQFVRGACWIGPCSS